MRGNIVPATHGETVTEVLLDLQKFFAVSPHELVQRKDELARLLDRGLRLSRGPVAYLNPNTPGLKPTDLPEPLPRPQARRISTVKLSIDAVAWVEQSTLLYSGVNDRDFRVEIEDDGNATIRFGKRKHNFGSRPSFEVETPRTGERTISATYRVGGGVVGNVGADTLVELRPVPGLMLDIIAVNNPLPAMGGRDLEALAHARRFAPTGFKKPRVLLTPGDYQTATEEFVDEAGTKRIQRANALFRWTGSWLIATLAVDPFGFTEKTTDQDREQFRQSLLEFLEPRRLAGYDVEIMNRPSYVPLELELELCVKRGFGPDQVRNSVLEILSSAELSGRRKGFFHPDHFTFGDKLFVSRIFAAVASVPGVDSAHITRLNRFLASDYKRQTTDNLKQGFVAVASDEIIRLDNDRNFPENGTLRVRTKGVA